MTRLSATVVGALIGGVAGYWLGVTIGCDWLIPSSNLCGIYTVFTMRWDWRSGEFSGGECRGRKRTD